MQILDIYKEYDAYTLDFYKSNIKVDSIHYKANKRIKKVYNQINFYFTCNPESKNVQFFFTKAVHVCYR